MVPGHEIVGIVARVGSAVKKLKTNDHVGVVEINSGVAKRKWLGD